MTGAWAAQCAECYWHVRGEDRAQVTFRAGLHTSANLSEDEPFHATTIGRVA